MGRDLKCGLSSWIVREVEQWKVAGLAVAGLLESRPPVLVVMWIQSYRLEVLLQTPGKFEKWDVVVEVAGDRQTAVYAYVLAIRGLHLIEPEGEVYRLLFVD